MKDATLTIIGTDLATWHWPYRKDVTAQEIARHLTREPTEEETEIARVAYTAKWAALAKAEGPRDVRCRQKDCAAQTSGTRDAIVESGWVMLDRRDGKADWDCPEHRPKGKPGMGLSTGKF